MEHQSAVTYGNRFANGYLERDWTGVGVSLKFDFIIIHESAHEWFGNAVSAADGRTCGSRKAGQLPGVPLRRALFGHDDALKYTNGYKIEDRQQGADHHAARHRRAPNQDMYFKGALFLAHAPQRSSTTMRSGGS